MTCMDCACPPARMRPARLALMRRLGRYLCLRRQRARLAQLDSHLLCDIGISAQEADVEARRPAWNAPAHWHR